MNGDGLADFENGDLICVKRGAGVVPGQLQHLLCVLVAPLLEERSEPVSRM